MYTFRIQVKQVASKKQGKAEPFIHEDRDSMVLRHVGEILTARRHIQDVSITFDSHIYDNMRASL
jgi:hypothetical protein